MIVPIPRSARSSEENVLPLINVVFLLLIFFMIAGSLSATAPFELEPPEAASPQPTDAPSGGITIAADGRIAFGDEEVPLDALAERARRWREQRDGGRPLALRADGGTPSERLLEVIDALRQAGVERVRLLAVGQSGERE